MQVAAHYLGHADALKGSLTVAENLAFWSAMLDGGPETGLAGLARPTPLQALEQVALTHAHDLPVAYLSAGQRRRAAIGRLIVAPRPVWLLDEPTTALDTASQQRFAGLMGAHLAQGGLIIAATHADLGLANARNLQMGGAR
jgi:heme exporter protein A